MNKMYCKECECINFKKASKSAMVNLKKTLDYISEELIKTYRTPDDVTFNFGIYCELHPNVIKVVTHFVPKNITKGLPLKPKMEMELEYTTDVAMTTHLLDDLLTILGRFGLSALYNRTENSICCYKKS